MAGSMQFWGLGSGLSSVGDMVDAMLLTDQLKIQGYQDKSKLITNKKNAWNDLKASIDKLSDSIKELSGLNRKTFKTGVVSEEGFLSTSVKDIASNMDYTITVDQLAQKHTVSGTKVSDIREALNLSGSFEINAVKIDVAEEDSLSSIMSKINSAKTSDGKSIGAKAHIIDGVIILESTETGKSNTIKVTDSDGVLSSLGLVKGDGSLNTTKEPQNAVVTINGITVERDSNTIDDAIDGVTLTLSKITEDPINLSIKNDKEQVKTMITDLVTNLNDLYSKISKYTSYDSATSTSGILNGDSSIAGIKNAFVTTLQGSFDGGEFGYLFEIGISVDRYGKLSIDDKKLDAALDSNIDDVVAMFTKGLDNPKSEANSSNGLLVRLKKSIDTLTSGDSSIFKAKTESFDRQIKNYDNLITRQQSYIEKRRAMLEAQFRAMEQTISSLNSQSGFLLNSAAFATSSNQ
ncbi:flagellar filament capping protein FliD [Clostridium perfringens]